MNSRILIAAGSLALCVSASRAQAPAASQADTAKNCIRVELMMFSGRPRPAYLICEDDKKEDLVSRLKAAMENPPTGPLEPSESTPEYRGLLIIQPKSETRVPRRVSLVKGKVNNLDSQASYRADSFREIEKYLLDLGESKTDVSRPGREEPLGRLVGEARDRVEKTK
ncbi:MAG: hypothetical protein JF616_01455 [Fibrobacteres bacterium]|nr:hypothetical protein [Fibrobacterota bacterium]